MAHSTEWELQAEYDRLLRIIDHTTPPTSWLREYMQFQQDLTALDPDESLRRVRKLLDAIPVTAWPPEEADALRGQKVRSGASAGGHRERKSPQPSGAQLNAEIEAMLKTHPHWSRTQARKAVGSQHGIPLSTLRGRLKKRER